MIESTLAESLWIVGGEYSVVDMLAYAHIHSLPELTPGIANQKSTPNLIDWLARIAGRPAVNDAFALRRSTLAPTLYSAPGC